MDKIKDEDQLDLHQVMQEEQEQRRKHLLRCKLPEQRTLLQALMGMTRDDLQDICYNLCVKGVSSLKKAALAERLQEEIIRFSHRWLPTIVEDQYQSLKKLSEDVLVEIPAEDRRTDYLHGIGVLACGGRDGRLMWYMPQEIQQEFRKLDSEAYRSATIVNAEVVRLATGLLFYYGVMDYDHLYAKVMSYIEKENRPEFFDFVGVLINASYWQPNIVTTNHGMHYYTVLHPEVIEHEQAVRENLDFVLLSYEKVYEAGEENYIEPTDAFKGFAQYLMQMHSYDVLRASDVIGEIGIMLQNNMSSKDVLSYAESLGLMGDTHAVERISTFIVELNNTMRLWSLKGHTPQEINHPAAVGQKGKVIPFRKKNQPGRNDPCPCGSGKKYKRCCMNKDTEKK